MYVFLGLCLKLWCVGPSKEKLTKPYRFQQNFCISLWYNDVLIGYILLGLFSIYICCYILNKPPGSYSVLWCSFFKYSTINHDDTQILEMCEILHDLTQWTGCWNTKTISQSCLVISTQGLLKMDLQITMRFNTTSRSKKMGRFSGYPSDLGNLRISQHGDSMPVDGLYHISIGCLSILSVLFGLLCPTCFAVADLFQSKCQLRSHSPPAPSTSITNSLRIGKSTEIIGKLTKIIGHGHSYGTLPEGSININNNMNMKGITQRKLPCWWHFHFCKNMGNPPAIHGQRSNHRDSHEARVEF